LTSRPSASFCSTLVLIPLLLIGAAYPVLAQDLNGKIQYYLESQTTSMARRLLDQRLMSFDGSKCALAFRAQRWLKRDGGMFNGTASEIRNEALKVRFYDCRQGSAYANWTLDQIIHNGETIRASETRQYGETARRIWRGPLGARTSAVLLWDFFGAPGPNDTWNVDIEGQQNTILHEIVHVISDWDHEIIFNRFYSYGLRHPDGSSDFTDWLRSKCQGVSN